MLRRRIIAAATTLVLALGVSVGGAGAAFATVPPPPVPTSEECVPQAAIPPTDDVVETQYQRYSWTGGPITEAPTEVPPSANWQANTANKENGNHVNDPVGVPFQRDNPGRGNADWFFWTATEVIVQAGTPGVDAVTCPDPEPEPQPQYEVGLYLYKKVDQTKPASWENSGPQIFIASTTGTDWFTSYPGTLPETFPSTFPGTLPQTVCGDGWAVQQDKVKHFGGFTWPALLQFPDQRLPIAPYQWKHEDLVPGNSLGLTIPECDLETEPLASVAFTWTPPACEVVQTVSVDPSAVVNATAHEPVVGDGTITFTVIADEGAAFSDDESDAPLFTAEDITASESDAPTFTWSVSDDFTVLTVTVTLTTVNPEECVAPEPIELKLTYIQECAPDSLNTWRVINTSDAPVTFRWEAYGTDRGKTLTAEPGENFFMTERGTETMKIYWFDGVKQSERSVTKEAGNDIVCDEIAFQDVLLACEGTAGSYTLPDVLGVVWTVNGEVRQPDTYTVTEAGELTITATVLRGYIFPGEQKSKTFTIAVTEEADCIPASIEGSIASTTCDTDVPYILFSIALTDPDNQSTGALGDAEIIFAGLDSEGNERTYRLGNLEGTVDENGVFSGRVLWPGAAIENGQAAAWPGWALVDGEWQNVGDDNFGWTRTVSQVTLSVDPTVVVDLSYPPASPDCATEPTPVPASIDFDYTCETGGVIELSDTPGVIWTVNGQQTDQRSFSNLPLNESVSISASLDPELPGLYFAPDAVTEFTVEFEAPEFICPTDLPPRPLVVPTVTSTQPTCTTAGSYTLGSDLPGVQWLVNGQPTAPGTYTAPTGSTVEVQAVALQGFGFGFEAQTRWSLQFTAPAAAVCAPLPTLALGDPVAPATARDLQTLALTGASGMLGTVGVLALLMMVAGVGVVVSRRRVES